MRQYCRNYIDRSTGHVEHVITSDEPIPDEVSIDLPETIYRIEDAVIGTQDDGQPFEHAGIVLQRLRASQPGRHTIRGEAARAVIYARLSEIDGRSQITENQPAPE